MSTRLDTLLQFYHDDPNDPFNSYALAIEFLKSDIAKAKHYFEKTIKRTWALCSNLLSRGKIIPGSWRGRQSHVRLWKRNRGSKITKRYEGREGIEVRVWWDDVLNFLMEFWAILPIVNCRKLKPSAIDRGGRAIRYKSSRHRASLRSCGLSL